MSIRAVWLGVGVALGLAIAAVAYGQQAPSWVPSGGGYVVGPAGQGSWNDSGGYFIGNDGTVSSWSGPAFVPAPVWTPPEPQPAWQPAPWPVIQPDGVVPGMPQ